MMRMQYVPTQLGPSLVPAMRDTGEMAGHVQVSVISYSVSMKHKVKMLKRFLQLNVFT